MVHWRERRRWEVTVTARGAEHAEQLRGMSLCRLRSWLAVRECGRRSSQPMTWLVPGLFESDEEWQEFLADLYASRHSGLA